MDEIIKELRSLPLEEFEVRFGEMYDAASDEEKDEMLRSFKKGTDKLVAKIDTFIEKTRRMLKHDEMYELQLA